MAKFLFDYEDETARGQGVDTLGTRKDGLRLAWSWNKGKIQQCCHARLGKFECQVTFWHVYYEVVVMFNGVRICSADTILRGDGNSLPDGLGPERTMWNRIKSRVMGQKVAENLLRSFIRYSLRVGRETGFL